MTTTRLRPGSLRSLVVLLALFLAGCSTSTQTVEGELPHPLPGDSDTLRVYFMNVGQGDGALVITPSGYTILIDAGPPQAGPAVVQTLRQLGVQRINLMVTSHPHADHIGGFQDVLDHFEVLRYADPGFPHTTNMYESLLQRIVDQDIDGYALGVGQWIRADRDVELRVLAPPDPFLRGSRSDPNSNSIVFLMTYGDVSILFTGDAEADTERFLLREGLLGEVDVLKVAHHGGAHSSTEAFLEAVRPRVAVISCGEGNSYGHPRQETLDRLAVWTERIFRTDLQGTIALVTDGRDLQIGPEATAAPSVEGAGRSERQRLAR